MLDKNSNIVSGTPVNSPEVVAHFLTQCLFCFFAEDVGLLPGRMFEGLVGNRRLDSIRLTEGLRNLFGTMQSGGMYGNDDIPWFNGGLFKKIDVPTLSILDVTDAAAIDAFASGIPAHSLNLAILNAGTAGAMRRIFDWRTPDAIRASLVFCSNVRLPNTMPNRACETES